MIRPTAPRCEKRKGMTLIEIAAAMYILLLGMVSVLALFYASARNHSRAMHLKYSSIIASHVLDDIRSSFDENAPPDFLETIANQEPVLYRRNPDFFYSVKYQPLVKSENKTDIPYRIELIVTYMDKGKTNQVSFFSVIRKKAGNALSLENAY